MSINTLLQTAYERILMLKENLLHIKVLRINMLRIEILVFFFVCFRMPLCHASSFNRADPYPLFTPYHNCHLNQQYMQSLKGYSFFEKERISFNVTPFGQNANSAGRSCRQSCVTSCSDTNETETVSNCINLGDIDGKWSMIGLLAGFSQSDSTSCKLGTRPCDFGSCLSDAHTILRQGSLVDTNNITQTATFNVDPYWFDPEEKFGFFTIPTCYRKRGIRFDVNFSLARDVTVCLACGVADICQTVRTFENLTPSTEPFSISETTDNQGQTFEFDPALASHHPINPFFNTNNINGGLMNNLKNIAQEIELDISNFHETSAEDVHLTLDLHHVFSVNKQQEGWAHFLFVPFIQLQTVAATGMPADPLKKFSVPFGNNGHHAVSFTGGFSIDFAQSIALGMESGVTHFRSRTIKNVWLPSSEYQSGIYPCKTCVKVCPGNNWHLSAHMGAYHFLERLSFYAEYVFVHHENDTISVVNPDPDQPFFVSQAEALSGFKSELANIAFNYDISPHVRLGFLWQVPIRQERSFKSSSVLFNLAVTF